jgi:hypothetical protein
MSSRRGCLHHPTHASWRSLDGAVDGVPGRYALWAALPAGQESRSGHHPGADRLGSMDVKLHQCFLSADSDPVYPM